MKLFGGFDKSAKGKGDTIAPIENSTTKKIQKAVGMVGSNEHIKQIRDCFIDREIPIDLYEQDMQTPEELIKHIKKHKPDLVFIVDIACDCFEGGAKGVIANLFNSKVTSRIALFCSQDIDDELMGWLFGRRVYDVFIADSDASFDFAQIAKVLQTANPANIAEAKIELDKTIKQLNVQEEDFKNLERAKEKELLELKNELEDTRKNMLAKATHTEKLEAESEALRKEVEKLKAEITEAELMRIEKSDSGNEENEISRIEKSELEKELAEKNKALAALSNKFFELQNELKNKSNFENDEIEKEKELAEKVSTLTHELDTAKIEHAAVSEKLEKAQIELQKKEEILNMMKEEVQEQQVRIEAEKKELEQKIEEAEKKELEAISLEKKAEEMLKKAQEMRQPKRSALYPGMTIGCFACSRGAGATYTSTALAKGFAACGYSVGLIGFTDDVTYTPEQNMVEVSAPPTTHEVKTKISESITKNDITIIDFGVPIELNSAGTINSVIDEQKSEVLTELKRCNLKVGLSFSDRWHVNKLAFYKPIADHSFVFGVTGLDGLKEKDKHTLRELQKLYMELWERNELISRIFHRLEIETARKNKKKGI